LSVGYRAQAEILPKFIYWQVWHGKRYLIYVNTEQQVKIPRHYVAVSKDLLGISPLVLQDDTNNFEYFKRNMSSSLQYCEVREKRRAYVFPRTSLNIAAF
jgi:hypothetical protein